MGTNETVIAGGPDSFMTVRQLTLRGTNFEIGRAIGEIARARYTPTPASQAAVPRYARARRRYVQRTYPILWDRMRGVADAFGVDAEDDGYDFTGLFYNMALPMPPHGCSVVYYPPATTATGRGYLSRNYDFSQGTMADVMGIPAPPEVKAALPHPMSEPYVMAWYPEDGGYASLAIQAFDLLGGTLDGINSEGLAVAIMADEEAIGELGPRLELHPGAPAVVGLHELQVMRWLLDTCATAEDAREALLGVKQYYGFVPCHYIVADRSGDSFVYENSTGRNIQYVFDGGGRPQVVTNFQLYKHPTVDSMPGGPPTIQTNAFWRYREVLGQLGAQTGLVSPEDALRVNACVNILRVIEATGSGPGSVSAAIDSRTMWHNLYDLEARAMDVSFFLGDEPATDGVLRERRSEYLRLTL